MIKKVFTYLTLITCCFSGEALAQTASTLRLATDNGPGDIVGTVIFSDTEEGLKVTYNLYNLPSGDHGFHVHENPDCSPVVQNGNIIHASAAGGH